MVHNVQQKLSLNARSLIATSDPYKETTFVFSCVIDFLAVNVRLLSYVSNI